MDVLKKNQWTYNNNNGGLRDYDLFGLRFYTIYQLLSSNHLKVENESMALGFIFHYTKV